jgi:hypothetical protein
MLQTLFPTGGSLSRDISRVVLVLTAVLLFMKISIALLAIVNGRFTATTADGIPLDSYPQQAAQTLITLVGGLGISQLIISAVGVLILVRYRALVPAFLLLLVLEFVARRVLVTFLPVERTAGAPGSITVWVNFALILFAFGLSLLPATKYDRSRI